MFNSPTKLETKPQAVIANKKSQYFKEQQAVALDP